MKNGCKRKISAKVLASQKQHENSNQQVEMMKNCKLVIETINAHRA